MNREEAKNSWGSMTSYTHDEFCSTIDEIYDDFESRTCGTCDRFINNNNLFGKCFLYDKDEDEVHHESEWCNRWEPKQ